MIQQSCLLCMIFLPMTLGYFVPHYGVVPQYPYPFQGYGVNPLVPGSAFVLPVHRSGYESPYVPYFLEDNRIFNTVQDNNRVPNRILLYGRGPDGIPVDAEFRGKTMQPWGLPKMLIKKISDVELIFNKETENRLEAQCRKKFNGTLVNDECYQYVGQVMTYDNARTHCQMHKGDLWTPDPHDAFLYYKMAYLMPKFGTAQRDELYIGAKVDSNFKVTTVTGEDITDTLLMNVNDFYSSGDCIVLKFKRGSFFTEGQSCSDTSAFICEYPLPKPTGMSMFDKIGMFPFNLFKKN